MKVLRRLALCAALSPLAASAACHVQSYEIPVTLKGPRAVAHVGINGTELSLLVDSGASFSFLTDSVANALNLPLRPSPIQFWGAAGPIDARMTTVERLKLHGIVLNKVDFLVGVNELDAGSVGLLGQNLLGASDTEYDLGHGAVRLMRPKGDCAHQDLAYWAGASPVVEVPLVYDGRDPTPPIMADVRLNGQRVRALLDTGATTSIVSLGAAKRAGMVKDETTMTPSGTMRGAGHGERESWTVPLALFELGGERIKDTQVVVADIYMGDAEMLLGIDFFLSHRILVARSQKLLYFTYEGGPVFNAAVKPAMSLPTGLEPTSSSDHAALARRGAALASRGEALQALAVFDRAIELAPEVAAYRAQRAAVRMALRQTDAAMADVDEALRLDPDAVDARLDRMQWRIEAGDANGAQADLALLDRRLASESNLRRRMGAVWIGVDTAAAVRQYDLWILSHSSQPDLHAAYNERCWARALGNVQLDQALADCERAVAAVPTRAEYLDSRGLVYLRQGRWQQAIADYDAALARKPDAAWSLWGRGLARLQAGMRDAGLADLANARAKSATVEAEAMRHGLKAVGDAPTATGTLR